jgi:deoxyribodipyrimidine photo-lyase
MEIRKTILWHRNDLRLYDNEALMDAIGSGNEVYPVFVFDDRFFKSHTRWFGFNKTNIHRCRFIIESIIELRNSYRELGLDLIVRVGKSEDIIFEIASELKTSWVYCNRERTQEELDIQDSVEKKLWTIGQDLRFSRGKMLYHTQDLPFPVSHTPETFTQYRKEVEKLVRVRNTFDKPSVLKPWTIKIEGGEIPTLEEFFTSEELNLLSVESNFIGGENQGIKRLNYYFWESDLIKTYKETRNGLLGMDYSSKFSPWLAAGCISPKYIYHELKKYESERGENESTYWLYFELLWRDYFRLLAKKFSNKIFFKSGTCGLKPKKYSGDIDAFNSWKNGTTGVPFIDANMRELNATGFMSNRGRQNVASFLVHDLGVNWQMGAEYFESMLIDYDVASNWGNWNYIAGVGSDPRENRYFNINKKASIYDPKSEYVKYWCPEVEKSLTV